MRMHDNPVLSHIVAQQAKGNVCEVLPVYCFDPRHFGTTKMGSPKTGAFRTKFLLESVADLRSSLRAVGSDLLVGVGKPEELLPTLVAPRCDDTAYAITTSILCQEMVTSEETGVDRAVRSALPAGVASFKTFESGTMYAKADLPYAHDLSDMPDGFTPFRTKVEARCKIPAPARAPTRPAGSPSPLPLPDASSFTPSAGLSFDFLPNAAALGLDTACGIDDAAISAPADERGVMPFPGGETAALARLKHYLWDGDHLKSYFETRNGMLGADYSSKFAPWLAHGNLSPRLIASECKRYERERVENKSTYWMVFELLWRDFFHWYASKHGDRIFKLDGPTRSYPWKWRSPLEHSEHEALLRRWKDGRLGVPLVDANMRELAATGFMSNRGRQNVASYLALDLQLDWRYGADHFESLLLDYDVASNWGNWVAAAGLTGGRVNRFNIVKQSKDYDPDGDYVRHWLPELSKIPGARVHEPWLLSNAEQGEYGVRIGVDYPSPPKSQFSYGGGGKGGGGGSKGRGKGGGGGGGRGGERLTPAQTAAIKGRGKGGRGGGGRKRVQHAGFDDE